MAKRDYKDTIVLEPTEVEEITEVVEEEVDEKRSLLEEEREKCEKMSKGELVDYVLQAKENLWCSHEEREKLQDSVKPLDEKNKELSAKVSDLEKEKRELIGKLQEIKTRVGSLEREVGKAEMLNKQVSDLKEQLTNKENAAKNTQHNLEKSHKKETDGLNETVSQLKEELNNSKAEVKRLTTELKKSEKEITKLNERTAEAESVNLEGISVKEMIERLNSSVDEVNADFAAQRKKLDKKHREKIIEICEQVVTDSQKEIITKQELREAKIKAKKKLESKRAQKEDLDAEIAELEDYVEANEA